MSEGFKKYFNATTVNGRANVAKATYGTLALLYIIYRVRRGGSSPPDPAPNAPAPQDSCICDADKLVPREPMPPPQETPKPPAEKSCSICKDRAEQRARKAEEARNREDPPPPPPAAGPECTQSVATGVTAEPQVHKSPGILSQVQEAAFRVMRNVIDSVRKETVPEANIPDDDCLVDTAPKSEPSIKGQREAQAQQEEPFGGLSDGFSPEMFFDQFEK